MKTRIPPRSSALSAAAATLITLGVLAGGSAGAAWSLGELVHPRTAPLATASPSPAPLAPLAPGAAPNYRAIVERYGPAVVGVTVDGSRKLDGEELANDPFFQFFRGVPGFAMPNPRQEVPFHGQGSGFIVGSDGVVLTNAHVVRDASEVTVKLHDRREYRARVLGVDTATDVAVLKIAAHGLPTVQAGDPRALKVGDYVLAIGAPFGFDQSATQGIVSATGRSLPGGSYVPFIQTDAAVNPGNSGGPLFDAAGRVVGINAQIYSSSGGFEGLAFAIPIDVALHVKDQIAARGHIEHAALGVTVQELTQPLAESFGLPRPDGAVIASVQPGSAAAAAGLQPGDVITQLDGKPVLTPGDLTSRVGLAAPGEKLALGVWRAKAMHNVGVTLGRADSTHEASHATADNAGATLGLAVRPLSPGERREAHAEHGLLVERAGGAAARAGIEPGDILLAANGRPLLSTEQLQRALAGEPKTLALLVQREDQRLFVPVPLG